MLASGNINPLGDGTPRVICLIHGLTVEANRPLGNGRAGFGCIHLDIAWILTWRGALQPDADPVSVVISISRTAASCRVASRRSAAGAWAVATSAAGGCI